MKLTPTQLELLEDIATKPQMFIHRYRRWSKTAQSLIARGLAYEVHPGSYHVEYEIRITEAGWVVARARGLAVTRPNRPAVNRG